jgi:hypothetical protein
MTATYALAVERMHLYYLHFEELAQPMIEWGTTPPQTTPKMALRGQMPSHYVARTNHRMNLYGTGYDYLWQRTRPGNNMHMRFYLMAVIVALVFLCMGIVFSLVWWWRLRASSMDEHRLRYSLGVVARSRAFAWSAFTMAGLFAGAGLVLVRFLQIMFSRAFNESFDQRVESGRDIVGWVIGTCSAIGLVAISYRILVHPRIKRRVLVEMGRCGHCGYPSTPGRPCSECGYSPPHGNSATV